MRRYGINIVYFGNLWNIFRSILLGSWDFKNISDSVKKANFYLMLLPLRGLASNTKSISSDLVITYESAWNISNFFPAIKKVLNKRLLNVLLSGSKTGKKTSSFTFIDRIAGDNVSEGEGTLIDWMLFGGSSFEISKSMRIFSRHFPHAVKSSHSLLKDPPKEVREIHPEMRDEYELVKRELISGNKVLCHQLLETELDLIYLSADFKDYLTKSNLIFCLDIFHALQRGRRDGTNPDPVVDTNDWIDFLKSIQPKVKEIHFRIDKREVGLILDGKACELKTYIPMCYMFHTFKADIIYELYPNLLCSPAESVKTLSEMHSKLCYSFRKTLDEIGSDLTDDEVAERFKQMLAKKPAKALSVVRLKRKRK